MTQDDDSGREIGEELGTGDVAILGEDGGQAVSMKALQAIYNELTGKTEELVRRYEKPFQIAFSDLEQLNHKFEQATEQYSIEARNVSVTLYHQRDTKEEFSSFERFRIYNKSSTSPVESILLKYSFLIVLPKTKKPQTYTVSVHLASRIAVFRRLSEEMAPFPSRVSKLMSSILQGQTGIVTINYVDYLVARNLLQIAEGWFDTLQTAQTPTWFQWLRPRTELFRRLGEYSLGGVAAWAVLTLVSARLGEDASLERLAQFLVLAFTSLFVSFRLGHFLGRYVESSIDEWTELSYLRLNRGDEQEIERATRQNRRTIVKAIVSGAVTFLVGIAASLAASWLRARWGGG